MQSVTIGRATSPAELKVCLDIRKSVFVEGQGVPIELEVDGLDDACIHFLLRYGSQPAGTARVSLLDGKAKVQRVALLDRYRAQGLGRRLMQFILDDLRATAGIEKVVLGSQAHAIAFYEALGFVPFGERYMDAGIPHQDMQLTFRSGRTNG